MTVRGILFVILSPTSLPLLRVNSAKDLTQRERK
jgi:hypothetical protein